MKGIKNLNKWRAIPCSQTVIVNMVKISVLLQFDQRNPNQNPGRTFIDISNLTLKFIRKAENQVSVSKILLKKNKAEQLILPDFKTSYKVTIIGTVWCLTAKRQLHTSMKQNIESETSPQKQVIFNKGEEKSVFSTNGARTTGHPYAKN